MNVDCLVCKLSDINHLLTLNWIFTFCKVFTAIIHLSCLVTPFHKPTLPDAAAPQYGAFHKTMDSQNGGKQRPEPLSDDFLFSMSSSTENRLSYASSPESDLELSPPPAPRLVKSSSDPSIATTQDNMDRDDDMNHMGDAVPPPYTVGILVS